MTLDVGTLFQRAITRFGAKGFQIPDENGVKCKGSFPPRITKKDSLKQWWAKRRRLFLWLIEAAVFRNYTGAGGYRMEKKKCSPTSTDSGKMGLLEIIMICVCMSTRGVDRWRNKQWKELQYSLIQHISAKCQPGLFTAEKSFPRPRWQALRLTSKNKLIFSWSPLHGATNNIPSSISFISLCNSEEIGKLSDVAYGSPSHLDACSDPF